MGVALIFGLFLFLIGLFQLRRRSRNNNESSFEPRIVGSHTVECPHCGEDAILNVYEDGDEVTHCRRCNYHSVD